MRNCQRICEYFTDIYNNDKPILLDVHQHDTNEDIQPSHLIKFRNVSGHDQLQNEHLWYGRENMIQHTALLLTKYYISIICHLLGSMSSLFPHSTEEENERAAPAVTGLYHLFPVFAKMD